MATKCRHAVRAGINRNAIPEKAMARHQGAPLQENLP